VGVGIRGTASMTRRAWAAGAAACLLGARQRCPSGSAHLATVNALHWRKACAWPRSAAYHALKNSRLCLQTAADEQAGGRQKNIGI